VFPVFPLSIPRFRTQPLIAVSRHRRSTTTAHRPMTAHFAPLHANDPQPVRVI
jgi:hypothetical protein